MVGAARGRHACMDAGPPRSFLRSPMHDLTLPLVLLGSASEGGQHGEPHLELLLVFVLLLAVWGAFRISSRRGG